MSKMKQIVELAAEADEALQEYWPELEAVLSPAIWNNFLVVLKAIDQIEHLASEGVKEEQPSEGPCVFFNSYFHDEESWYVEVTEEEYEQLLPHSEDYARGNWNGLISDLDLVNRDHLNNPNLDRCIEIAVC